jgi:hypothetical protein
MADTSEKSAVNFQSESGNVDFQSETGQAASGLGERLGDAVQGVNWNKVGIGVGAAAAVAGAAYAATRYAGSTAAPNKGGRSSSGSPGDGRS